MALTLITVKLINPTAPKKTFKRKFLVDSGAVYSVVDQEVLKDLGIKGTRTMEFTLANGQTIERDVGEITFEMKGQAAMAQAQAKAQAEAARNQLDQAKAVHQAELERMKLQLEQLQAQVKAAESGEKLKLDYARLASEQSLRLTELELKAGRDLNADARDNARFEREMAVDNDSEMTDTEEEKDAA